MTTTNPLGVCFVSYRRVRLPEVTALVQAMHEVGVPTWQDLTDLDEQLLEKTLRAVLADPNTASGVLWVTPEVAGSRIITDLEVPGLTDRAADDPVFNLVPVAAGGLNYDEAAAVARSATSLVDLNAWNIRKVAGDPATADDVAGVAHRVMKRRVGTIHNHLPVEAPFVIDVYTRNPTTRHPDAALTIDFTHLFEGRIAKTGTWDTVTTALRTVMAQVARGAPGRPVHLRGQVGLPTAVALGTVAAAPSGTDVSWVQRTPSRDDSLYSLSTASSPSAFAVTLTDRTVSAADLAVLVSVSENVVPAFQATSALGPFRGVVTATAPGEYPHMFESPGQAVDLAQEIVRRIRMARTRYGAVGDVHLFIAGPAGLAFLIGQLLNTLGVVTTYEHVSGTGTGTYQPAIALQPST